MVMPMALRSQMGSTVSGWWDGFGVGCGMFLKDNVARANGEVGSKALGGTSGFAAGRLLLE